MLLVARKFVSNSYQKIVHYITRMNFLASSELSIFIYLNKLIQSPWTTTLTLTYIVVGVDKIQTIRAGMAHATIRHYPVIPRPSVALPSTPRDRWRVVTPTLAALTLDVVICYSTTISVHQKHEELPFPIFCNTVLPQRRLANGPCRRDSFWGRNA